MHRDNPYPPDHPYPPPDDIQYHGGKTTTTATTTTITITITIKTSTLTTKIATLIPSTTTEEPTNPLVITIMVPSSPSLIASEGFITPVDVRYHSNLLPFCPRPCILLTKFVVFGRLYAIIFFFPLDRLGRECSYAKLYVATIPKTVTEYDICSLFEKHGNIVEVVFTRDKEIGIKHGTCFVKYATAERAIRALHCQYTFPGESDTVKVKFADGEKERLGVLAGKLYVNHLNRLASKKEIEEIFSPYGMIEEIYILYDEMRRGKGCGFVKYSFRDMAEAAIRALNGTYIMKDCDQPLVVRFADPKKPRHHQQDVDVMPPGFFVDQQSHSHCPQPSQEAVSGTPRELNPVRTSLGREQQESFQSPWTAGSPQAIGSVYTAPPAVMHSKPDSPVVPANLDMTASLDCDWSEHACPDGFKYYYNCETSESRWEKPEEYALFENKVLRLIQLQNNSDQQVHTSSCQKELGQMKALSSAT